MKGQFEFRSGKVYCAGCDTLAVVHWVCGELECTCQMCGGSTIFTAARVNAELKRVELAHLGPKNRDYAPWYEPPEALSRKVW